MAIQMRRGSYSDFVPSRMLAGEFAVMTSDDPNTPDGKSAYVALSPNDVERLLTETDLGDMTDAAERAEAAIEAIGDISELAVPLMTEDVRGGAKLGAGLAVVDDTLSLSGESYTSAEKTKLAGVEAGANDYTLPVASPSTLGGVKPDGISITVDSDGTIHSSGGSGGGDVSGVKGDAESTYRTGNVNLTPANIGAAAASHNHAASDITSGTLSVTRGGTGQSSLDAARGYLGSMPQATCDTNSSNLSKVATLDGFSLYEGARVAVKFSQSNTASSGALTLNVNNTGAKVIKSRGLVTSSSNTLLWNAGAILDFYYDGSNWCCTGVANATKASQTSVDDAEQAIADLVADVDEIRDSVSHIGTIYSGAWTATISQGYNTQLTESIQLPKGTYIVVIAVPYPDTNFLVSPSGSNKWMSCFQSAFTNGTWIIRTEGSSSIYARTGTSATTSYSSIEYGGIYAIKISD